MSQASCLNDPQRLDLWKSSGFDLNIKSSKARGAGLIHGRGTKISHALRVATKPEHKTEAVL